MINLKEKIRDLALTNSLDYVGFASAEALKNEPEGIRPDDFLPGARSIISIGIKLTLGSQLANKIAHGPGPRHLIYAYLWNGFNFPSLHYLDRTALLITRLIEKEGHIAVPMNSASTFDVRNTLTEFSNLHAAVAAGLGELCWSGQVLTSDAGPRVRFGAIVTNAVLDPDLMYSGPELCDLDKCKAKGQGQPACVSVCPTKAISSTMEQVVIGDRTYEVASFDRCRCMWGSMGLTKKSLGTREIPMPEKLTFDDVFDALKKRDPHQTAELMVIGRGDYCGQCIMECPVGSPGIIDDIISKLKQ